MKNLKEYICENKQLLPDNHLSIAQLIYIRNNIDNIKFDFELSRDVKISNIKTSVKNNHSHISYDIFRKGERSYVDDIMMIEPDYFVLGGGNGFDLHFNKTRAQRDCELIDIKVSDNNTIMKFKLDGVRCCRGFERLYGTATVTIPGDILNIVEDFSKFDCKGYDKYMNKFLPAKASYLHQFEVGEDVLDWESKIVDNILYINVTLPTGKAYGSSKIATSKYIFNLIGPTYKCKNRELYDNDDEAQVVRKFISGVRGFVKYHNKMPSNVIITTTQQLD